MAPLPRIRFKPGTHGDALFGDERELILVGGAITTPERFRAFTESLCHLHADGNISCFGLRIGTREDIEFLPSKAPA